jgi:adenylate cyclase
MMEHTPKNLRLILMLGTAALVFLLQAASLMPGTTTPFERIEYSARDWMMRLRGTQQTTGEIVIVAIDDFSFSWTKYQWPWPRAYLAEIVEQINQGGGKVVGLDIILANPDKDPANDIAFAKALDKSRYAVTVMQIINDPASNYTLTTLSRPAAPYMKVLDGTGITAFTRDEDAIVRGLQAYDVYNGEHYYNWVFEVASLYLGVEKPTNPSETNITFNGQDIPLRAGQILTNYSGPAGTFPTYSASDVHDGIVLEQNPEAFRDKIVLIGATTVTLQDVYPTPFSAQIPTAGVEIVASTIDTIIHCKYLHEAPPWVAFFILLIAAMSAAFITKPGRSTAALATLLGIGIAGYLAICAAAFITTQYILPIVMPLSMLFLSVIIPTLEQAVSQEIEKRRVRALFSRFISPEMVDQMIGTQDINSLNKRADLTILFSDIRGFTTLSEKLTPEGVVKLLNPYLAAMTDVIHKHGGTVDKYEGDAIVAFFGEPIQYKDHAIRTVSAAVDMLTELEALSAKWIREGLASKGFNIGIGINSGDVFVGMLGSAQRINYTIIGDNANLAARLQDQTKTYSWPILISESTYQQVKDEFDLEFADAVTVKGKTKPVNVYKVLGRKNAPESGRVKPWQL